MKTTKPAAWWMFWGAASSIGYAYAGFPALLGLRALTSPQPVIKGSITPRLSVIICAYNEADVILKKLDNLFALDYPREQLEVIVASDGSSDGTAELVRGYDAPEIKLLDLPRQGKNRTLNTAVSHATGDILVFSDADSMLMNDALRHLVAPFADQTVGGVAGDYRYAIDIVEGDGERTYWGYDRLIKEWQARAGSITSATGQIYAIRRELFCPVPLGVTDDFFTSSQVPAAHMRLVFEPKAVAFGPVAGSVEKEYKRKVRVMTRGFNSVYQMRRLMNPADYGFYAVQLFSHKVIRRLMAIPLLIMALTAPALWQRGLLYRMAALAQLALHGAGLAGYLLRDTPQGKNKALSLPMFFQMVNLASLVAVVNVLRGQSYDTWMAQRTIAQVEQDELEGLREG